jgi:nicotinamidase-related amidase
MIGTGLIAVDIQKGFKDSYWGRRNNPDAELHMVRLFDEARARGIPIFHVQHLSLNRDSPLHPESPGSAFFNFSCPRPYESVFQKHVNSAFIGTDLEAALKKARITRVFIMGFTSDHCVSTTVRMAANLGFQVYVNADAVCTFDRKTYLGEIIPAEQIHQSALASLHEEFATVYRHSSFW